MTGVLFAIAAATLAPATSADLAQLQVFADCVVTLAPKNVEKVLGEDFRTNAYRKDLQAIADYHQCLLAGRLRANPVLMAGFMAEAILKKRLTVATVVQSVAYRADRPILPARDEGEVIALCVARTAPAQIWALLGTKPGQMEEAGAVAHLTPLVADCTKAGVNAKFNKPGLRAILALAMRRLAANNGTLSKPGKTEA